MSTKPSVTRYEHGNDCMEAWPDGRFVLHADYAALEAERDGLGITASHWGHYAKRVEAERDAMLATVLEIVATEPELPGDGELTEKVLDAMQRNREAAMIALRVAVKLTKKCIAERINDALARVSADTQTCPTCDPGAGPCTCPKRDTLHVHAGKHAGLTASRRPNRKRR